MKQHLRFLLLTTLTSVPVVSVVACGTSSVTSITNQDILTKAEGLMRNQSFTMTSLTLENIPDNGTAYTSWSDAAKTKIAEYYGAFVSSDSSNWEYETVSVSIRGVELHLNEEGEVIGQEDSIFLTKYGLNVESRINLTVDLSFKGLTSSVPIVVKVTNNETPDLVKLEAIRDYLKDYLNKDPDIIGTPLTEPIQFKELFEDNLKYSEATFDNSKIERDLSSALLSNKKGEIPVIDIDGIKIHVKSVMATDPNAGDIIYTLTDTTPAVPDPDHPGENITPAMVNGTLQKLTLSVELNGIPVDLKLDDLTSANQQIQISQTFPDVNNQIYQVLKQGNGALVYKPTGDMPTAGQTFASYGLGSDIQSILFTQISSLYPPSKMNPSGNDWWTQDAITFPNQDVDAFVYETEVPPNAPSGNVYAGYFIVKVNFECQLDGNSKILAKNEELRINLSKTYTPTP